MTRANTMVWITLMLLTCISFALGDQHAFARIILLVAGVKFALVAWQFMDLRKASRIWSALLLGLLVFMLGLAALAV